MGQYADDCARLAAMGFTEEQIDDMTVCMMEDILRIGTTYEDAKAYGDKIRSRYPRPELGANGCLRRATYARRSDPERVERLAGWGFWVGVREGRQNDGPVARTGTGCFTRACLGRVGDGYAFGMRINDHMAWFDVPEGELWAIQGPDGHHPHAKATKDEKTAQRRPLESQKATSKAVVAPSATKTTTKATKSTSSTTKAPEMAKEATHKASKAAGGRSDRFKMHFHIGTTSGRPAWTDSVCSRSLLERLVAAHESGTDFRVFRDDGHDVWLVRAA